ncbi:MAG: hypothetical protein JSW11_21810 [Candidatus Heimdallarchaeota archaeon]|nr:MAG: hypothetical protein JSW11_21810 [Candidatus Heimdallarchaeota archaeon]
MKRKTIFVLLVILSLLGSLFLMDGVGTNPTLELQSMNEQIYQVNTIPFSWIDIVSTGTHLILSDDSYSTVVIPFDFPFYDEAFTTVLVSSNGFLTFNTSTNPSKTYGDIPQSEFTYLIALYWTDLYPDDLYGGGGVYYQSFEDYLVIQYHNISTCCSGYLAGDFEVVLHSSGIIQMFYANISTTLGTIGVDRGNSEQYTTYSIFPPVIEAGIEFSSSSGVTITSDTYYDDTASNYRLTWIAHGDITVDYYEVFVNDTSQGTTTDLNMTIPVSSPSNYNLTVVLHATDLSTYEDTIFIIMKKQPRQYMMNEIPFSWININTTGTHLVLGDDSYQNISLPFTFPFYNETFDSVLVSSNGFLTFFKTDLYPSTFGTIPQTQYKFLIALFWTDLNPDDSYGGGGVYYQSFGTYCVIQYEYMSTCCNGDLAGDFEVILHSSGLIQMFYTNMAIASGTIGVDKGDNENYTAYSLISPVDAVGIEFFLPGVVITSPHFYLEEDIEYTIKWSPMGVLDVIHYEILVNDISQGTTTDLNMTIPVSSPSNYNITVVLYTDLSYYSDQIHLAMVQPIVTGLYVGAFLSYEFINEDPVEEYSYIINTATIIEELSSYRWLVNLTTFNYEDKESKTLITTYSSLRELDSALLSSNAEFWSNAHQLSIGDTFFAIGTMGTIEGEKVIDLPGIGSIPCWKTEVMVGEGFEIREAFAYYCKKTGVFIALEAPEFISGRLIDFNYPFGDINERPTITIDEPKSGDTFDISTDTIEVQVTASDDKAGLKVKIKLDGGDWQDMTHTEGDQYSYTFTDLSAGRHTVRVVAIDNENLEATDSIRFTIETEETSTSEETEGELPSISPGFEVILPLICLFPIFFYRKHRKS